MWGCHSGGGNQLWHWDTTTGHLSDSNNRLCVTVSRKQTDKSPFTLAIADCEPDNSMQVWKISVPEKIG